MIVERFLKADPQRRFEKESPVLRFLKKQPLIRAIFEPPQPGQIVPIVVDSLLQTESGNYLILEDGRGFLKLE